MSSEICCEVFSNSIESESFFFSIEPYRKKVFQSVLCRNKNSLLLFFVSHKYLFVLVDANVRKEQRSNFEHVELYAVVTTFSFV